VRAPQSDLPRDLGVGTGVGAFAGLLGVGGGILLVPYLVLVRGVAQKSAQATSLVMLSMAATTGTITYAWGGSVAWLPGAVIAVGGVGGALLGAVAVQRAPDHRIQAVFGLLLVLAAVRLLWPQADGAHQLAADLPPPTAGLVLGYLAAGLAMGLLSALFGVGGGILLIPVLVAFFDYGQQLAAGTSLAVMVPIGLVGALRLTRPGYTRWAQGARFGLGAMAGAVVGAAIALAVSGFALRLVFAAVMVAVGVQMTVRGWRAGRPGPSSD
jgi:uncharacterized membrane protein YfcA